jgi:hypothetical protein
MRPNECPAQGHGRLSGTYNVGRRLVSHPRVGQVQLARAGPLTAAHEWAPPRSPRPPAFACIGLTARVGPPGQHADPRVSAARGAATDIAGRPRKGTAYRRRTRVRLGCRPGPRRRDGLLPPPTHGRELPVMLSTSSPRLHRSGLPRCCGPTWSGNGSPRRWAGTDPVRVRARLSGPQLSRRYTTADSRPKRSATACCTRTRPESLTRAASRPTRSPIPTTRGGCKT